MYLRLHWNLLYRPGGCESTAVLLPLFPKHCDYRRLPYASSHIAFPFVLCVRAVCLLVFMCTTVCLASMRAEEDMFVCDVYRCTHLHCRCGYPAEDNLTGVGSLYHFKILGIELRSSALVVIDFISWAIWLALHSFACISLMTRVVEHFSWIY